MPNKIAVRDYQIEALDAVEKSYAAGVTRRHRASSQRPRRAG